ncbi:MAG: Uma2 family endonuclease [Planctomycetes bacterium]|nr:Uma2 family endonuclease [Planctomycetota bacterium]
MRLLVCDEKRLPIEQPWVIRLPGWTEEQFLRDAPEKRFCEFVRGEVIMPAPVNWRHQAVCGFLSCLACGYCANRGREMVLSGPAALHVAPDVIREPDIFVLPAGQQPVGDGVLVEGVVPALIVEILSPSTRTIDLADKAREYADMGVPDYWAVDLAACRLHAHRLGDDGYDVSIHDQGRVRCGSIPGFWIDAGWLWRQPLPSEPECLKEIEGA